MAWIRIDDHFSEHPKLARVGPDPRRPIAPSLRRAVFVRDDFGCGHCGVYLEAPSNYDGSYAIEFLDDRGRLRHLQVDHVLPLARGGTNDFDNLQTLCSACNGRKGVSLDDWEILQSIEEHMAEEAQYRQYAEEFYG